jgi:hypothetical protein
VYEQIRGGDRCPWEVLDASGLDMEARYRVVRALSGGRRERWDEYVVHLREVREDRILVDVDALDPMDRSLEAEHLREVAGSIRDHREMARRRREYLDADGRSDERGK